MPTEEWFSEIHHRLLEGDPTASAELAEKVIVPLTQRIVESNPAIEDHGLISDACSDAVLNYLSRPQAYDSQKRGLFGYLAMSAQGDLVNALDSIKRKKSREKIENAVELDVIPRNQLSELAEKLGRDEVERQIAAVLPDIRDQEAAMMIIDGEKATVRFAAVFGCDDADKESVERAVKRNKDRINKTLQRKLRPDDE
ncbi:MAG: hypothetical protein AAFV88_17260 [Planctomycetota bacterium]